MANKDSKAPPTSPAAGASLAKPANDISNIKLNLDALN
jgi:hypothetical protein